jgi:glycosyltransferase involved in cell wall biosynthesis
MPEAAAVLVVPCHNEERRLDTAAFITFAQARRALLLFVNDGSTDGTARVLRDIQEAANDSIQILHLEVNQGKAEAVRRGLSQALDAGAAVVAYCDADLSTPLDEVERLLDVVTGGSAAVAIGSRVALMGTKIERHPMRHYLGRIFASAVSLVLHSVVYDTQCGAKCFRASPALRAALAEPFLSRWAFDVELLGRLLSGTPDVPPLGVDDFVELPLRRWRDVGGSKLTPAAMVGAAIDLVRIRRDLRRRHGLAERMRD